MTTQEIKRKLATILSGDVKRYSRLLVRDEAGTLRTLNTYKEVITNLIRRHKGKVIDAPGDHVLAEFSDAIDAVCCAVEIQKELKNRNDVLPEPRRLEYRFGIAIGEVLKKDETIFGDGVNIAVRIQNFADAGGICLSGTVCEQIKNKSEHRYDYIGKQTVQSIAEPVRIYRVLREGEIVSMVHRWKRFILNYWKRFYIAITIIVALVGLANGIWQLYPRFFQLAGEVESKKQIAVPIPDKPSTAGRFDGTWVITLACPKHEDGALGYSYQFIAHVKNGVIHGQYGTADIAPNLTLDGKINSDGGAVLSANGLTGDPKYLIHNSKKNMPYAYHIAAKFSNSQGTGKRIEDRDCNATFVKR